MIFIDYCFRSRTTGKLVAIGWAHGALSGGLYLASKKLQLREGFLSRHRRSDLAPGCTGFVVRFDLPLQYNHLDMVVGVDGSDETARIPPGTGGFADMARSSLEEVFADVLLTIGLGHIALEAPEQIRQVHARAQQMADVGGLVESGSAALALDMAHLYDEPCRIVVSGWMATDQINQEQKDLKRVAMVLDEDRLFAMPIDWQQFMRADLSDLQIGNLRIGVSSGYIGAARPNVAISARALCVLCLSYKDRPLVRVRALARQNPEALGNQLQRLSQTVMAPDTLGQLLKTLSPRVPTLVRKTTPDSPDGAVAIALSHNMDHGLIRDVLRYLRNACPEKSEVVITNRTVSEHMVQSAKADQAEAGERLLNVRWISGKLPVADWSPGARYLIVASSTSLFQVNVFPLFREMRTQGVPIAAVFLSQISGTDFAVMAPEDAKRLCLNGVPFVVQLDLKAFTLDAADASAFVSQSGQLRWLLHEFARAGLGEFREYSAAFVSEGSETASEAVRFLENLAFPRDALERQS